jgi:hypothetical protein
VSVDTEWSKGHVLAIGLKLLYYVWILMLDNLRPGGAIRGISGTLGREGRGEGYGYSEVFYVVAPTCVG